MSAATDVGRSGTAAGPNGILVGLGGLVWLIGSVALVNALGDAATTRSSADDWLAHAGGHVLLGTIVIAIALTLGRIRRTALQGSWSHRSLTFARVVALLLSGTSLIEAVGAYPPLGILHIWWASAPSLALLVLGFLAIAGGGVVAAVRGH